MEEIREFCFKEFAAVCLFWNFFVLWSSDNITYYPKRSMLIAAIPYYPSLTDSHQDFFYVLYIKLHMHLGFRLLLKFLHLHRI